MSFTQQTPVKKEEEYAAAAADSSQKLPELTTVNGIGMWNQWTRNFKSPLLALLDLMDNAFDAACVVEHRHHLFTEHRGSSFLGRIHLYTDRTENDRVSGLVLKNNSPRHIKPMAQVLQVYQSCKGNLSDSIGENGVGLKQGCATLSDLSFCLSKNLRHYSLGILSRSLQREEGCSLPSFTFPTSPTFQELQEQFEESTPVMECVEHYGNGSLARGIKRLLRHIQEMDDSHVFMVILHHLRHGSHSAHSANTVDYAQSASGLLSKLRQELPRQYIHVPSTVDVRLQNERIAFAYWQHRLIELTSFKVKIDPNHAVMDAQDWIDPEQGYSLRIYAGFDPIRVDESTKSPISLFVYSRQSGRLIKHTSDARSVLGLTSGGTEYCQGLTILVDDVHGKLPLNPTKQDLAFGEEPNGEIHRSNLNTWLSAVAKLYYGFHLSKFENKKKGLLTEQVKRHVKAFQNIHFIKPLPECHLTKFENVEWNRIRKGGRIYARNKGYRYKQGSDTLVQLKAPKKTPAPKKTKTPTTTQLKTAPPSQMPAQQQVARSSSASSSAITLPVIEISNLRKRKATDDMSHDDEQQPDTCQHILRPYINKLERDNAKLQEQKNELERQNVRLKKALSQERSHSFRKEQESKDSLEASNHERQQELARVKKEVEALKRALAASQESVQVARNETEIQEEIANDLRKKWAELKMRVKTNS